MLHRDGHDEATEEHVVGGVKIVDGNILCRHQAKKGKSNLKWILITHGLDLLEMDLFHHRYHCCDGEWESFCEPVEDH